MNDPGSPRFPVVPLPTKAQSDPGGSPSGLPVPPGLTRQQIVESGDTTLLRMETDTLPSVWGITLEAPKPFPEIKEPDTSTSWLFAGLLLCFIVVAIRFQNNGKFLVSLWKDITEVRERRNVFDETVRETSFLVLLNILWLCCSSILLGCLMKSGVAHIEIPLADTFGNPTLGSEESLLGVTLTGALPAISCYTLIMFFSYWMVGNVFSDSSLTKLWVRGYGATNGILSVSLFPIVLATLCYPALSSTLLPIAGIFFILAKILFLYKGYRIFFSQGSSWVLFLYYLCSLEIVPLILLYVGAWFFARIW